MAILVILCILIIAIIGMVVIDASQTRGSAAKKNLKLATSTLGKVEPYLRNIANGTSGNPTLEAQIALDEINNYYNNRKELN